MEHFSLATVIAFLPALVPVAGLASAWLQSRYGHCVRLKFGSHGLVEEVEVRTMNQLRQVLQLADEYQHNHKPQLRYAGARKGERFTARRIVARARRAPRS